MTKQNSENSGSASCSVDALALALQKLELSILQSNDALNNRMKLLETKFDGFQSFLTDTEKTRTQNVGLVLNAVMTMTNNVTQLLLQSYQQRAVLENQMIAQRNAPADIQQLLQANALRSLQSMMPQQQAAVPSQQPPVLPTAAQVPLFSQPPPPTVPPPAVFPTPQPPVPMMQPSKVSQPLFPTVQPPKTPIVQPSAVVIPQVPKPAAIATPTSGFGDKFIKKEGEWDCDACYLRNKSDANQCVACQASRDGKKIEAVKDIKDVFKPSTTPAAFSFGFKSPAASVGPKAGSIFGAPSLVKSTGGFGDKPPVSFSPAVIQSANEAKQEEPAENEESPEEFVPNAHYEPVVPLPPKVEVQTGEEDEQKLFDVHGKLYINTTDGIKERGIGNIKILRNSKNNKHRVIMRRDQIFKVCLNAPIVQGMVVNDKPGKDNVGLFSTKDFSDAEYPDGKAAVFLVKFSNPSDYQEFKKFFNECAGQSKAAASSVKDEAKPSAPSPSASINLFKPNTPVAVTKIEKEEVPNSTTPFSFTTSVSPFAAKPFGTKTTTGSPFASNSANPSPFNANTSTSSIFGGGAKSGFLFGSTSKQFGQSPALSFGDLSKQTSFLDKSKSETKSFGSTSLQLNKDENADDAENATDESPEAFVPDAHYEPVVPLPPKVDIQTGEEDEQKLFDVHGKLYINTTDGIKERGIGNIKILRNLKNNKYRVIMRRDQVLKICLNAPIVQGMAVKDKPGKDNVGLFSTKDFSDAEYPDGKAAVFLVKFSNPSDYQEFKKIFNECAGQSKAAVSLEEATTSKNTASDTSSQKTFGKIDNRPGVLPLIESEEAEDEEDDDYEDEEGDNYEDEHNDMDDYRVIYEVPCNVTFVDAYLSPMQKNSAKAEIMKDVQLIISTPDDDGFRIAFEKTEDEEQFPHFLDKNFTFNVQGNSIQYVARHETTGQRKSITCEFKDSTTFQKTLEELEHCREITSYEDYDD